MSTVLEERPPKVRQRPSASRSLFDGSIVRGALVDCVRKLDPRVMVRNPVMFVVEIGSVLTTFLLVRDFGSDTRAEIPSGPVLGADGNVGATSGPVKARAAPVRRKLRRSVRDGRAGAHEAASSAASSALRTSSSSGRPEAPADVR